MIKCQVPDNATRALTPNTQISTSSIPTVFSLTGYERVGKIGGSTDRSEDLTAVISCKFRQSGRSLRFIFCFFRVLLPYLKNSNKIHLLGYIYIHERARASSVITSSKGPHIFCR